MTNTPKKSATGTLVREPTDTCNARLTKQGKDKFCTRPSGWGTPNTVGRCKLHGGANPGYQKEADRLLTQQLVQTYGLPTDVDPQDALLQELARTNGHVIYLQMLVAKLPEPELTGKTGVEGTTEDGLEHHPRAEHNAIITLYQKERTHLRQVAKDCVDAGLDERRVRIAEAQGALIARTLQNVLVNVGKLIGIDLMANPDIPKIVRDELLIIEAQETEAKETTHPAALPAS